MENNQDTAALLREAGQMPSGTAMEDFNPLEQIPTLAIGKDIVTGQKIVGRFVETQRLTSAKFIHSQETDPTTGLKVQYLHVFELLNKKRIGIWSTGELYAVCEKLAAGELIAITYKGKGTNAKGQAQHFFEYQREAAPAH